MKQPHDIIKAHKFLNDILDADDAENGNGLCPHARSEIETSLAVLCWYLGCPGSPFAKNLKMLKKSIAGTEKPRKVRLKKARSQSLAE